jgi:hypothetical protein
MNQHVWGGAFVLTIANELVMNWERHETFSDVSEKVSDVSVIF